MSLQLDLSALAREVQRPFEQIAARFPLNTQDFRNSSVTDAKLATRIVRGAVAADGSITRGTGFTVTKNGTGDYTVNITTAFAATPVISLTRGPQASAVAVGISASTAPSASAFRVSIFTTAAAVATDCPFDFIAISV